jgi:hypothetical protein
VRSHLESVASEHGRLTLKNFLDIAADRNWNAASGRRRAQSFGAVPEWWRPGEAATARRRASVLEECVGQSCA